MPTQKVIGSKTFTVPTSNDTGWGVTTTAYLLELGTYANQVSISSYDLAKNLRVNSTSTTADGKTVAQYGMESTFVAIKNYSASSAKFGALRLPEFGPAGADNTYAEVSSSNSALGTLVSHNQINWKLAGGYLYLHANNPATYSDASLVVQKLNTTNSPINNQTAVAAAIADLANLNVDIVVLAKTAATLSNKTINNLAYIAETATITTANLTPTSTPPKSIQRITSATATLGTIANPSGAINTELILLNVSGAIISILNDSGSSSTSILTGTGDTLLLANNASIIVIYDAGSSRWRVIGGSGATGGGGGSTSAVTNAIAQTAHGFTVGKWVYLNGANYALARADVTGTASVVGVVSAVADVNNFTITTSGVVTGLSALTAGVGYFLSTSVAGNITNTEPTTNGQISAPVGMAISATSMYVNIDRKVTVTPTGYTPPTLPILTGTQVLSDYTTMLTAIHSQNVNAKQAVIRQPHGFTFDTFAYEGCAYSPTQNRIYLAPSQRITQPTWHYIDCTSGNMVAYDQPISNLIASAGCVYAPTLNRIYFVPTGSSSDWYYLNCTSGEIVTIGHGLGGSVGSYNGGVYSPTQNRIYFVPSGAATQSSWHYVDCTTGNTYTAYTHGATAVGDAYWGGVYSPTQNRIYLVPYSQASQTNWHYIDCATGNIVAYAHGATVVSSAYAGGVYSPTQNRIYLVPRYQSNQTNWHYIDCATGNVVAYAHGITAAGIGYTGGVYSPTQNRIYLCPYGQGSQAQWHYIDCATGNVIAYNNVHNASAIAFLGGAYSPTQNRIYLAGVGAGVQDIYFVSSTAQACLAPHFFGSTIISSTY